MFGIILLGAFALPSAYAFPTHDRFIYRQYSSNLEVKISVADGFLKGNTDGRIVLMFAPNGTDPLDDTDVTSSPNKIYGKNVYNFGSKDTVTFSGGSNTSTLDALYGWPNISINDIPAGTYNVQAFLNRYETVTRSDGSTVSVHFPCGDGAPNVNTFGSLITSVVEVTVLGGSQTLELKFDNVTAADAFTGKELGGCYQGNYEDSENLKHLKIKSQKLSDFWGRDMYVGANIVLPAGYNANDTTTRYPVIYSQGHWPGGNGAFRYGTTRGASFTDAWNKGTIPGTNKTSSRLAPKMILVTFRHEAPFYDDSYAVNTANLGPYGDAINDELIPHIESTFHTIRAPYARIQEGGSTGGWESAASLIFRPDLFGACFSSYPDSLDFHRHQDIELYTASNAYQRADGSFVPSIRTFQNDTQVILATVANENHWELTFGTASRSSNQWDIWNAIFGVQGYNNYPLEPWDKVTGEIYPAAVEFWKPYDLSNYITSNWDNSLNLGKRLAGRVYIYVGTRDDYFLNEGVQEFQKRTDAVGGAGWANVTILEGKPHGGNYQDREIWDYLQFLDGWIKDHAPNGSKPLGGDSISQKGRGNIWKDVIERGGRKAAVARQADPEIQCSAEISVGGTVKVNVGRWDPGVTLKAQWIVNGKQTGQPLPIKQGTALEYKTQERGTVQLSVKGSKRNYMTETRKSKPVKIH